MLSCQTKIVCLSFIRIYLSLTISTGESDCDSSAASEAPPQTDSALDEREGDTPPANLFQRREKKITAPAAPAICESVETPYVEPSNEHAEGNPGNVLDIEVFNVL